MQKRETIMIIKCCSFDKMVQEIKERKQKGNASQHSLFLLLGIFHLLQNFSAFAEKYSAFSSLFIS